MLSEYSEFLSSVIASGEKLEEGKIEYRTNSKVGYILSNQAGKHFYLHTGPSLLFNVGDSFLFTYDDSMRCKGRLDVAKYVKMESIYQFVNTLWACIDSRRTLLNQFYRDRILGNPVDQVFWAHNVDELTFRECIEDISEEVAKAIIEKIDIQYIPWCLEYSVPENKICRYIVFAMDLEDADFVVRFYTYAKGRSYSSALALLAFLMPEASHTESDYSALSSAFSFVAGNTESERRMSTSSVTSFITRVWEYDSRKIAIVNACFNHKDIGSFVSEKIAKEAPVTGSEFVAYIMQFSSDAQQEIVKDTAIELLPWYLECGVTEERVCQYLAEKENDHSQDTLDKIASYVQREGFLQAGFLIELFEHHRCGGRLDVLSLTTKFNQLTERLFAKHSITRSKIEALILYPCDLGLGSHASGTGLLTNCEGKHCSPRSNSRENFDSYTLCRRKRCHQEFDGDFNEAPLYSIVKYLFCIDILQLHQNEQFLRLIAALNRWNEIVDRLHCRSCNSPLSLSEHARQSVGRMAYAASYWHCGTESCLKYCESIKITHCYGCGKVIDSRDDSQSCNPWEVRSYKKFYICKSCASCCQRHEGFSGCCPNCGVDKAYANVEPDERTRAQCRQCGYEVSINRWHFDRFNYSQSGYRTPNEASLSNAASSLIFPESLISPDATGLVIHDWSWSQPILYVYDLFACLRTGRLTLNHLEAYPWSYASGQTRPTPGVYDIKVLERLVYLGVNHRRYSGNSQEHSGFISMLAGVNNRDQLGDLANDALNQLFSQASPEVWKHYNEVEWPFMRSLYSLCGTGLTVNRNTIDQVFTLSERARNVLVQKLRTQGIDTPDEDALLQYVKANYGSEESFAVSRAIRRADYKAFKETDPLCATMHKIEKIERGVSVCKALMQQPQGFIPDYQMVGSDTTRCTSRNPNLLGLPKELRPIIQATPGCGIVECDYGQMEVGIMAALAEDQQLIDDYNSGDVYQRFAEQLDIKREQAKLLFLSILYGVSNKTLAQWLGHSPADTKRLAAEFFQRYPRVAAYQQQLVQQGRANGFVETYSGLKRWVNQQAYQAANNREELDHWQTNWFKNFPVQAGSAIIFKMAIIDLATNQSFSGFKLIAPMYDSIAFEAPLDNLENCTNVVVSAMKRAMEAQFPKLSPRIKVNNQNPDCWNAGVDVPHYQQWLEEIITS